MAAGTEVYEVTAPDGTVLEVTGPAGASHDEVIRQAQALYKPQAASSRSLSPSQVAARQKSLLASGRIDKTLNPRGVDTADTAGAADIRTPGQVAKEGLGNAVSGYFGLPGQIVRGIRDLPANAAALKEAVAASQQTTGGGFSAAEGVQTLRDAGNLGVDFLKTALPVEAGGRVIQGAAALGEAYGLLPHLNAAPTRDEWEGAQQGAGANLAGVTGAEVIGKAGPKIVEAGQRLANTEGASNLRQRVAEALIQKATKNREFAAGRNPNVTAPNPHTGKPFPRPESGVDPSSLGGLADDALASAGGYVLRGRTGAAASEAVNLIRQAPPIRRMVASVEEGLANRIAPSAPEGMLADEFGRFRPIPEDAPPGPMPEPTGAFKTDVPMGTPMPRSIEGSMGAEPMAQGVNPRRSLDPVMPEGPGRGAPEWNPDPNNPLPDETGITLGPTTGSVADRQANMPTTPLRQQMREMTARQDLQAKVQAALEKKRAREAATSKRKSDMEQRRADARAAKEAEAAAKAAAAAGPFDPPLRNIEIGIDPKGSKNASAAMLYDLDGNPTPLGSKVMELAPELATTPPGKLFDDRAYARFKATEAAVDATEKAIPANTLVPTAPILQQWRDILTRYTDASGNVEFSTAAKSLQSAIDGLEAAGPQMSWADFVKMKRNMQADTFAKPWLRQAYGSLMEASGKISPELAQANGNYSAMRTVIDKAGIHPKFGRRVSTVAK